MKFWDAALPLAATVAAPYLAAPLGIGSTLAGALGSGLASYAMTGDLTQAVRGGLTGYGIGSLVGNAAGAVQGPLAKGASEAIPAAPGTNPALMALNNLASDPINTARMALSTPVKTFGPLVAASMLPGQASPIKLPGTKHVPESFPRKRYHTGPVNPESYGYSSEQAMFRYRDGGLVDGQGSGRSDGIAALVDNRHPARISSGEYVIPADAVSRMGHGSTMAGARELDRIVSMVRSLPPVN